MFSHQARSDKKKSKKTRGKLLIDTTCAVQNQVFPYESRVPKLKFISFSESEARKEASKVNLEERTPVYSGAEQSVSELQPVPSVRSQRGAIVAIPSESEQTIPSQERLPGRKPEPLKLDVESVSSCSGTTPTIVVTPARNGFRSTQAFQVKECRPASSVYSRYTNCMTTSAAPPVPPLPFMTHTAAGLKSRFSTVTATTAFERDNSPLAFPQTSSSIPKVHEARLSGMETPGLPTPRRSKGWWNVLSPFSAKSSRAAFWRSPSPASDCTPVLRDAVAMDRSDSNGEVLCSAPAPIASQESALEPAAEISLRRSSTAPAAFGTAPEEFDMYHIASTGLAAAYFDVARRFPSLYVQDSGYRWSPSQSVFVTTRDCSPTLSESIDLSSSRNLGVELEEAGQQAVQGSAENSSAGDHDASLSSHRLQAARAAYFSTPSEDELRTPAATTSKPTRAMTQTTNSTMMSPLSATPEVQHAHLGISSFGQKRIAVSRAPTPTALDEKVSSYEHTNITTAKESLYSANVTRLRPTHTRQDSYGLGISHSKHDLFPPPTYVEDKPRLGMDRYGQLKVIIPQDQKPYRPWYRRHFWLLAFLFGALLVLLVVMLAVLIPQKHHGAQVQATWLNLSGIPAMAIGISTVIQPSKAASRDTCTQPSLWTCSDSAERLQAALPNFRMEVRFRKGTLPSNETAVKNNKRDAWQQYVYTASPSAPSTNDKLYLGRTTDNTSVPYNGEETPFSISLINPVALVTDSKLQKRSSNFSYPYPSGTDDAVSTTIASAAASTIPNAALKSNGKPVDSSLYPYVTSQPLRLYDRGQDTEHYGFYTYYDRSIYISTPSSSLPENGSTNITTNVALHDASAVCIFAQTRMLVQIWTRQGIVANLTTTDNGTSTTSTDLEAKLSTANDMTAPGSFPYPVTFTIDRHGGQAKEKGVYCYALDDEQHVDTDDKVWVMEDRAIGGLLVNAAVVPGSATQEQNLSKRDDGDGQGIDGGTGGCFCQYESQ